MYGRGGSMTGVALVWLLCLGTLTASATAAVSAHTFASSSGLDMTGAAESRVTGSDGVTKGECAFTDADGNTVKVTYSVAADGQVEAQAEDPSVDPLRGLHTCRETVAKVSKHVQEGFRQHTKLATEQQKQITKFLEDLTKEKKEFEKQQKLFTQTMAKFQKKVGNSTGSGAGSPRSSTKHWLAAILCLVATQCQPGVLVAASSLILLI